MSSVSDLKHDRGFLRVGFLLTFYSCLCVESDEFLKRTLYLEYMTMTTIRFFRYLLVILLVSSFINANGQPVQKASKGSVKHYLYVAVPGIRDYLGYGGHGVLVFDIDNDHRFVKRISTKGFHPDGSASNVKGIAVSVPLNSIFISTIESLQRIDLATDKLVWEKQ